MTNSAAGSREIPIARRAARVVLIDGAERVLLFRGTDPGRPGSRYWFTPGGGLDPGESVTEGAIREVREETGLRLTLAELGEPRWHETTEYPYDGRWYRQEQDFFLVRVPEWEVSLAGFDHEERRSIDAYRWWPIADLETSAEQVHPAELARLIRSMAGL